MLLKCVDWKHFEALDRWLPKQLSHQPEGEIIEGKDIHDSFSDVVSPNVFQAVTLNVKYLNAGSVPADLFGMTESP